MAKGKDIRNKISSIKKTRKITHAMQMVAAGKRRKVETRMRTSMPYANKLSTVVEHITQSSSEYLQHPYLQKRAQIKRIGLIVIGTDRGLCGGLNINLFKHVLIAIQQWQSQGIKIELFLIGGKAGAFFKNLNLFIRTQVSGLGDTPVIADLVGMMKDIKDAYDNAEIDSLYIAYNEFVNTMVQKPILKQLIPLEKTANIKKRNWDYIYEPNSVLIMQTLLIRYIEIQIYQAVVDNIACEQAARMVAMQSATENADKFIDELQLIYNKARQAGITQEIIEVIAGAEAV